MDTPEQICAMSQILIKQNRESQLIFIGFVDTGKAFEKWKKSSTFWKTSEL